MFKKFFVVCILGLIGFSAHAEMTIACGPDGGVYKIFCGNFQEISPSAEIEAVPTNGAVTNLKMCIDGEVTACLVNPDQLFVKKVIEKDEKVDDLSVITPLYWNKIQMFSKRMDILDFSQFQGKKIGTFGGGAASLDAMLALTGVKPAQVINFDRFKQLAKDKMIEAYLSGQIDSMVGIGGGEIPWAQNLPKGTHLVGFDMWDKVQHMSIENGYFYRKKTLSYDNIEGSVTTLAVRTILVASRLYGPKDPETKAIQTFYADLNRQLPQIRKNSGKGKKYRTEWLEVSPLNEPSWNKWFPHLKK